MVDQTHITHVAHHAAAIKPLIQNGTTMIITAISSAVAFAVGAGMGWYVKGRGMAGVKIDMDNIKMDIANLKGKIDAQVSQIKSA